MIALISAMAVAALACNLAALINPGKSPSAPPSQIPALASAIASEASQSNTSVPPTSGANLEIIYMAQPAANSAVSSPLIISGEADSTFEQNLVIRISAEDGSQLALAPMTIKSPLGSRRKFSSQLSFSVTTEQAGRVSVYSISPMTGGLEHLNSVEVTLSPGNISASSLAVTVETIGILQPKALDSVSGGVIQISGFSEYFFESTLAVILCGAGASGRYHEFCGSSGNIIAWGNVSINSADVGQAGPFSGSLNYTLSSETAGKLIVYAISPRDGGILHLNSVPIQIKP